MILCVRGTGRRKGNDAIPGFWLKPNEWKQQLNQNNTIAEKLNHRLNVFLVGVKWFAQFLKLRGQWHEAKSTRWTAVFGNSRKAEEGLHLHWIRPSTGQGPGRTSDSDGSTNSCLSLRFKGKSLDSYKSQIDTPASLRRLSSWHFSPDKNTVYACYSLYLQTRYELSHLQKPISHQRFSGLKQCIEKRN